MSHRGARSGSPVWLGRGPPGEGRDWLQFRDADWVAWLRSFTPLIQAMEKEELKAMESDSHLFGIKNTCFY